MLATVVTITAFFAFIVVAHTYALRAMYTDALNSPKPRNPLD
jgi:hypothetical protein